MQMGLAILACGDFQLALWLHTTEDPPNDQWDKALARIAELKVQQKGDISNLRMLILSDGGAPNAAQRSKLFTDLLEGRSKAAGVTTVLSNRLKRGIATAIGWLNPAFKAYSPEQFQDALTHLDLPTYGPQALEAMKQLQRSMPPNKTLELILATKPA